jgi:phage baseplate assembly protein W
MSAANPLTNELQFSDLGITFTPHPVTGRPVIKKNAQAVIGALKNLIFTNRFERPYEPTFGSDIRNRLFENFDAVEAVNLEEDIRLAIENFEPRVEINEIKVIGGPDNNTVSVYVSFFIVNQADPEVLQLDIERIR